MRSDLYEAEHDDFRQLCRDFLAKEAVPHHDRWEREGIVDRSLWRAAGSAGLLATDVSVDYGGRGIPDYRYAAVLAEELVAAGVTAPGFVAHNDIVSSYLAGRATPECRERWLPGLCSGERVAAIAMTEPSGGSDVAALRTTAVRDGDSYILNGRKTFITNGENADVVVVAARTGEGTRGLTLLAVERGAPGFSRGERMDKLGWHASDTCELVFEDCRVPATQLIGRENTGAALLMAGMPRERLSISVVAVATAEKLLSVALDHARQRTAFGQPIGSLQHNRFLLAELDTEVTIARVFLDRCIEELNAGRLTVTDAARVKWWTTELQMRVADRALQLHGGHGYLRHATVAKEWANSRAQTIYGGSTEVMKELIGRSLHL